MNRRIDVAERPFVGGNLAVGVKIVSRSTSSIWSLAKSTSTSDNAAQW